MLFFSTHCRIKVNIEIEKEEFIFILNNHFFLLPAYTAVSAT